MSNTHSGPSGPLEAHLPSGAAAAGAPGDPASFDPAEAMREILAINQNNLAPEHGPKGPSLSFAQRCAIFAAARQATIKTKAGEDYMPMKKHTFARAFGISAAAAGQIINCLSPNGTTYHAVAREYRALGEEAFIKRYFTQETRDKLLAASGDKTRPEAKRHSLAVWGPIIVETVDQGQLMLGILWSKGDKPDAQPAWRIAFLEDMEPIQFGSKAAITPRPKPSIDCRD